MLDLGPNTEFNTEAKLKGACLHKIARYNFALVEATKINDTLILFYHSLHEDPCLFLKDILWISQVRTELLQSVYKNLRSACTEKLALSLFRHNKPADHRKTITRPLHYYTSDYKVTTWKVMMELFCNLELIKSVPRK